MKNQVKAFLILSLAAFEVFAQTNFLNKSSGPAFWGSCFAVVRKEVQTGYAATQNIGLKALATIADYGSHLKNISPQQYQVFIKEADRLNGRNISAADKNAFVDAFAECVNAAQTVRQKQGN